MDGGLLAGEHRAGAAETHGDLVGDQVHSIFRAQFPGPLEIDRVIHRHPCRALYQRFDDEGGRFRGVFDQMRFQDIRTAQGKFLGRFACFGQARIRRRNLHRVPQQGRIGGLEQRNISHRQRADGFAVIAVLEADEAVFLRLTSITPEVSAHFQCDLGSRRAIRAIERVAQPGQPGQPLRERHDRFVGGAGQHHMLDPAELVDDRGVDARIAVAEQIDPPARNRVKIAPPAGVDQPHPFAARNRQRRGGFQLFHLGAGVPDGSAGTA